MAAPTTGTTFLDMLRKSNLLPPGQLADYLGQLVDAEALPPVELAKLMVRDGLLTGFQANHLLKGRYKNFYIGKFKVLEPLGRGGQSQVFLCEHAVMRHRVALKMLPIKESTEPAAVNRFLREARAAAAVNHPNVVRAHDFDQSDGRFYYLIMDFVDGVNLHDLVKKIGPLPPHQAANYIAQSAAGLQHIYENGLIHRDLKPSNLLLDRGGVVRILDLGLARFTEDEKDNITRQFQNNTIMGTADYLAPEQALMMENIDVRADIYSLGATFYFLLSGKAPFEQSSVTQKLLAHQLREPDFLPAVPKDIQAVVSLMMRKQPDDRPQSPTDVIDAIAPWLAQPLPSPDPAWFPIRGGAAGPGSGGPRSGPPTTATGTATSPGTRVGASAATPRPQGATGAGSLSDILAARSGMLPRPELGSATIPMRKRPAWRFPVIIVVAVLVAAVIALLVIDPFKKAVPPDGGGGATASKPLAENRADAPPGSYQVSRAGPYTTVAEAVEKAPAGTTIVLTDAEHFERLEIENPKPGVTVRGWPAGRKVKWKAPPNTPVLLPLVRIGNATDFTLTDVELDGNGTAHTVLVLTGRCPGTRLTEVAVSGCTRLGISVLGSGEAGRELRLSNLLVRGRDNATGVRFGLEDSPQVHHVVVERSRFEGPLRAGVAFAGPADAVAVRFCRFADTSHGVQFAAGDEAVAATIANCTFAYCSSSAIDFGPTPPPVAVAVTNCLFFRSTRVAVVGSVTGRPATEAPWVWHNEGLPPDKETNVPAGTRYFRKSFDLPAAPAGDVTLDVGCVAQFKVWVNGTKIGASSPPHFTQRVFAFPVEKFLTAGANAIAIEGTTTGDPVNPSYAVAAGLTAKLSADGKTILVADASWKSSAAAAEGWTAVAFADAAWTPARPWVGRSERFAWGGSVWDSVAEAQRGAAPAFAVAAAGNVRDYLTIEGYPLLNCVRGNVAVLEGTDKADDATYLRTPRQLPKLHTLGANGGPVGVPTEK